MVTDEEAIEQTLDGDEFLSAKQAAIESGRSRYWITTRVKDGRLPGRQIQDGKINEFEIRRSDLMALEGINPPDPDGGGEVDGNEAVVDLTGTGRLPDEWAAGLASRLHSASDDLIDAQKELTEVRAELTEVKVERAELATTKRHADSKIGELEKRVDQTSKDLEHWRTEHDRRERDLEKAQQELKAETARSAEARAETAAAMARAEVLAGELESAKAVAMNAAAKATEAEAVLGPWGRRKLSKRRARAAQSPIVETTPQD